MSVAPFRVPGPPPARPLRAVGGVADGREVDMPSAQHEITLGTGHDATRYSVRFTWLTEQTPDTPVQGRTQGLLEWLAPTDMGDRQSFQHLLKTWGPVP